MRMLAAKAQYSLADAKRYFREHLSVGDYYTEGQHVPGRWYCKGAADLELSGTTNADEFVRLCENLHPKTGEQLTLRRNTTRAEIDADGIGHQAANRRVFYDFTFSPPKSVSIAALAGGDARIVEAHDRAVSEALQQLESFAATRVRKNGQCADRATDNIVAAVFRHDTSRALDPHLHSHCILFNATFDPVEKQWKALQNHDMLAAQKFVENVYYHELTRQLVKLGYQIEKKPRGGFEIEGISPELIGKFSKRHRQIDESAKELLAREPEKASGNQAAIRENIAHRERPPKIPDMPLWRLQRTWDNQMTAAERESVRKLALAKTPVGRVPTVGAEGAITWAEEHLFERRSVVNEHELWRHALEYARGENLRLADIQAVTRQRDYIRDEKHPGKVTSPEHLQRECEIVRIAADGRGTCHALAFGCQAGNPRLDAEQRNAVNSLVSSADLVSLFRGGAGTGKSFAVREVQRVLQEKGCAVMVVAPQRQQVIGLEQDGLQNVETVSRFLIGRQMPRNAVVLVDEAGQIGGKQMHALLSMVKENYGRVILSGDTRQHGAVEATDALRVIEKYSGIGAVELTAIRRQNPALAKSQAERQCIEQYKQAVADARDGNLARSFNRLDKLNVIEQCTLANQHEKIAARYLELAKGNQSCVAVSQSWNEIHKVNDEIRAALKRENRLGHDESVITAFLPVDLTVAQKRDTRSYAPDSVLVFNRDARGFKAGEAARLKAITDKHLIAESGNRTAKIPFKQLDKLSVCQSKEMALCPGDRLQLKANGRSVENMRLANGELVTVKAVGADGQIVLADGRTLDKNYRQFVRGYAVTSYASQGKSVDYVLFSDSAVKAATNNQQWYVTISRGKKGIHICTCDKEGLRENITCLGDRPLALDAVAEKEDVRTVAVRQIQEMLQRRAKRQQQEVRRMSNSIGMGM
jgi:conjugative relaxase-like TrwC/TraI family protein